MRFMREFRGRFLDGHVVTAAPMREIGTAPAGNHRAGQNAMDLTPSAMPRSEKALGARCASPVDVPTAGRAPGTVQNSPTQHDRAFALFQTQAMRDRQPAGAVVEGKAASTLRVASHSNKVALWHRAAMLSRASIWPNAEASGRSRFSRRWSKGDIDDEWFGPAAFTASDVLSRWRDASRGQDNDEKSCARPDCGYKPMHWLGP